MGVVFVSRLANVWMVRNEILRSVRLKMFVMYEVSLPIYVKLAHFCVVWVVFVRPGWGFGRFYWKGVLV